MNPRTNIPLETELISSSFNQTYKVLIQATKKLEQDVEGLASGTTQIASDLGEIEDLTTTDKSSAVAAINEVKALADNATSTVGSFDSRITQNTENIGDLDSLSTEDKTSLVGAINEVDAHVDENAAGITALEDDVGDLAQLTTTDKSSLVDAVNEVHGLDAENVKLTGAQTVAGKKTFSALPQLPALTTETPIESSAGVGYDENGNLIPIRTVADIGLPHSADYISTDSQGNASANTADASPTENSTKLVESGGVYSAIDAEKSRAEGVEGAILDDIARHFDAAVGVNAGDFVIYQGVLYRCDVDHTGDWEPGDFTAVAVMDELQDLSTGLMTEIQSVKSRVAVVTSQTEFNAFAANPGSAFALVIKSGTYSVPAVSTNYLPSIVICESGVTIFTRNPLRFRGRVVPHFYGGVIDDEGQGSAFVASTTNTKDIPVYFHNTSFQGGAPMTDRALVFEACSISITEPAGAEDSNSVSFKLKDCKISFSSPISVEDDDFHFIFTSLEGCEIDLANVTLSDSSDPSYAYLFDPTRLSVFKNNKILGYPEEGTSMIYGVNRVQNNDRIQALADQCYASGEPNASYVLADTPAGGFNTKTKDTISTDITVFHDYFASVSTTHKTYTAGQWYSVDLVASSIDFSLSSGSDPKAQQIQQYPALPALALAHDTIEDTPGTMYHMFNYPSGERQTVATVKFRVRSGVLQFSPDNTYTETGQGSPLPTRTWCVCTSLVVGIE